MIWQRGTTALRCLPKATRPSLKKTQSASCALEC
jgi:hypothetical protein